MTNNTADLQKIFRSSFIERIKRSLSNNDISLYSGDKFRFDNEDTWVNPEIKVNPPALVAPEGNLNFDGENSIILFEAYKSLTPTQATDIRLWTYLTHVTYWDYMNKRRPIFSQPPDKQAEYILEHWHINSLSATRLMRNDISLLWWGAYLTYDPDLSDPYILTKELFSMLDYTRALLPGTQGRNRNFLHAVLQYAINNPDLFKNYKESKIRYIMRRANFQGGYKLFSSLSKKDIMNIFVGYTKEIEKITD